jgi:hypothetical protein
MDSHIPNTEEATTLLRAINDMRTEAMMFVSFIGVLVVAVIVIRLYWKGKKDRLVIQDTRQRELQTEQLKQARAQLYKTAMEDLTRSFAEHTNKEEHLLERLDGTLDRVSHTMGRVDSCLTSFMLHQTQSIGLEDSRRIIKDRFMVHITHAVQHLLEKSLTENDFENRQAYVTANMKTEIGRILTEARNHLREYSLAIESDDYFTQVPKMPVERFALCDILWSAVESLYRSHDKLAQRVQELHLRINNEITDYFTKVERKARVKSPSALLKKVNLAVSGVLPIIGATEEK